MSDQIERISLGNIFSHLWEQSVNNDPSRSLFSLSISKKKSHIDMQLTNTIFVPYFSWKEILFFIVINWNNKNDKKIYREIVTFANPIRKNKWKIFKSCFKARMKHIMPIHCNALECIMSKTCSWLTRYKYECTLIYI